MQKYTALGIMSGTSLDGLDLALCEFTFDKHWFFTIKKSETINYSINWKDKLSTAFHLTGIDLIELDRNYGQFIGEKANAFIQKYNVNPDIIASHGHTVFHQPEKRFTLQIGSGAEIASITGIKTISDFRSLDVALNGQGAPLVPIGDKLLFSDYDYCINIGGFANISFEEKNKRRAYDIGPANILLNYLAQKLHHDFDKNGQLGLQGTVNLDLLNKLNNLSYYQQAYPKSLGREWLEANVIPLINKTNDTTENKLATAYEHIAIQIANSLNIKEGKVLLTGGGALNTYLIELIKSKTHCDIVIPSKSIIEYKEALIFAFLGILRLLEKINTLASVTGAKCDSSGGSVFIAPKN